MEAFNSLPQVQQQFIQDRFILPTDTSKVEVNESLVPFERISGALIGCTVINTNFHIHENKNK
jgi:hypothetical protein